MGENTPAAFSIRPAQLGDAAEIAELSTQLGYPVTDEQIGERLRQLLANSDNLVAVAVAQDDSLLGWIAVIERLILEYGLETEIAGLVVRQGLRRMGVGKALVANAEAWASARGRDALRVRSNTARVESHPFYERLGYIRTKTQHCYRKALT